MPRVIKPDAVRCDGVTRYEHSSLENIEPGVLDEQGYIDPTAVLHQAKEEAEQLVQEAYAEGLRRGMAAGQEQFDETVAEAATMLHRASEELQRERREFLEKMTPEVVELSATIARRILRREAQIDKTVVRETARAALEKLHDQERVTLYLHPDDLTAMREHRVTLLEEFDGIEHLELLPRDDVDHGGCIAESSEVYLDARVESQLTRILQALEGVASEADASRE